MCSCRGLGAGYLPSIRLGSQVAMPGTSIGEVQRMNLEEIFVATVMRGREGAAA